MEIKGNSTGAALYAMQQAMRMPRAMMDLLQKAAGTTESAESAETAGAAETAQLPASGSKSIDPKTADLARMTGKGRIINTVA